MKHRRLAYCVAMLLCLAPTRSSLAADVPAALRGPYEFTTIAKAPNGKPFCEEHWTFGDDGVATVESGQEIVHYRYRVDVVGGDNYLVENWLGTNGLPDCQGHVSDAPAPERRAFFYFNAMGGFVLCAPPGQYKGQKFVSGCYATVEPKR